MKRLLVVLAVFALLCMPVAAANSWQYVTDFDYTLIRTGGEDGVYLYNAYAADGAFVMGTMTSDGEQTRLNWSADGWSAMFTDKKWSVTVHGDASSFCPYASSHADTVICPYKDVALVTLTNTESGVTIENRYLYRPKTYIIASGGSLCWGKYGYKSPETLKWSGEDDRVALCDDNGKWGVLDTASNTMLTPFVYDGMSAVHGEYVKVCQDAIWTRLDLSGVSESPDRYSSETAFSITEELRQTADGYRVYNADNEPISALYTEGKSFSYNAQAHVLTVSYADGTTALLDLNGDTVVTFAKNEQVKHLYGADYAVERYASAGILGGVALLTVANVPQPQDTVVRGDINMNGTADSQDVRRLLYCLVNEKAFTAREQLAAEMTADGRIDSSDARALITQIVE